ncbi:MAG: 6,7-dimethyl-8-ribityllumazine synthase [Chloroflexi bacterium]|nr:6,7-dimethyl-8-ribityllumazine synthase [Chloroflexota bacterium]
MKELQGSLEGKGLRIAVVAARFNEFITTRLVAGAHAGLLAHGVQEDTITLAWVPGSFEIPLVARKLAQSGRYDAVICLGAVIKGETAHFEYVAGEAARGVAAAARDTGVPVIFGILTTLTTEQAIDRAGGKQGNRGYDAAIAAIQMANLMRNLTSEG